MQSWLDSLDAGRNERQDTYLFGFSAGMAMASALLIDRPDRYAGVALLSGTLPFDTDLHLTRNRLRGAKVFYAHGSFDRVIPADLVTRTAQYLQQTSGADLTMRAYPIAHEISAAEMRDFRQWIAAPSV
jgi:phospholipase/carboxylesterase